MSHDFEQLTITYSEKSLHFLQPAGTSRGVYHERKVWYVEARARYCGRTIYGIGECAPLPHFDGFGDSRALTSLLRPKW